MVQPEVAATALADELLTKQGFMSRILACAPESLIGKRMHKASPPEAAQVLQQYKDRMLSIMETPYPLVPDTRNELEPRDVPFSADATALFWEFADEAEKQMAPGGDYDSVRAFAAKLPEHAARLGATIAAYRDLNFTELSREDFLRGMQIAVYYATEAKRISGANTVSSELSPAQKLPPAQKLLDWLQHDWTKPTVTARDIYTYGPRSIRDRQSAIDLAEILVKHGWLAPIKARRRNMKEWQIIERARPMSMRDFITRVLNTSIARVVVAEIDSTHRGGDQPTHRGGGDPPTSTPWARAAPKTACRSTGTSRAAALQCWEVENMASAPAPTPSIRRPKCCASATPAATAQSRLGSRDSRSRKWCSRPPQTRAVPGSRTGRSNGQCSNAF